LHVVRSAMSSLGSRELDNEYLLSLSATNQDLLRASLSAIGTPALSRALLWLQDKALYPPPISIHWDLTLRCHGRCLHCKQWTWPKHTEFSVGQLEQTVNTFAQWGVETVTLGGGNPLLHDHIIQAIRGLHKAGIQVGLITEGAELTTELRDTICDYVRWIRFSIDGPEAAVHDAIRNSPGLFDRAMDNIQQLRNPDSSLTIGLNCVVQKGNIEALSQMIDLAELLKVNYLFFKLPHGDHPDGRVLLSSVEYRQFATWVRANRRVGKTALRTNLPQLADLLDTVFREEDVVIGRPVHSFYVGSQAHCYVPLFFLTCDSEGNMYPCDYLQADTRIWGQPYGPMRDTFCLGNVLEDGQQVLANSAILLKSRVHDLPGSGLSECGCCTRFCQLNASLGIIERIMRAGTMDQHELDLYFQRLGLTTETNGFL
jgi:AdoMet-dependent heme synthase